MPVGGDGDSLGVRHAVGIVGPQLRPARFTDRAEQLALGREDLDLMTVPPIADVQIALRIGGEAAGIFQTLGNQHLAAA